MALPKEPVRIFFSDMSWKTVAVDETATCQTVFHEVAVKINLRETNYFALYEIVNHTRRKLDASDMLLAIVQAWDRQPPAVKELWTTPPRIEFSKWNFNRPRETKLEDPVATHLFFIQAVANISDGLFDPTEEEIIALAGLHCQAVFGDIDDSKHHVGLLTSRKGHLEEYVPPLMIGHKAPVEWERIILGEFRKHVGKSELVAQKKYLEKARQIKHYAVMWFDPCRCKEWPDPVFLGIGPEGVHVMQTGPVRHTLASFAHTKVRRWIAAQGTFGLEIRANPDVYHFSFETTQSKFMDECMQQCIQEILLAKKLFKDSKEAAARRKMHQEAERLAAEMLAREMSVGDATGVVPFARKKVTKRKRVRSANADLMSLATGAEVVGLSGESFDTPRSEPRSEARSEAPSMTSSLSSVAKKKRKKKATKVVPLAS